MRAGLLVLSAPPPARFQWHGLPFEDLNHEPEMCQSPASKVPAYRQSELQEQG